MAKDPKTGSLLYHLTSLENLRSILADGLKARGGLRDFRDVADKEIVRHREEHDLNNFVPFHFMPGSPFAGAVQKYHSSTEFVYITIKRSLAQRNNFKILIQHPLSLTEQILYDYNKGIEAIDWEVMGKRDYSDPNCKNVCMAECLAPKQISVNEIHAIYCKDEAMKSNIDELAKEILGRIPFYVTVNQYLFKR